MKISIEHHGERFNVALSNGDKAPFLVIKGCRIVQSSKGPFVSGPAEKKKDGSGWWNHTFMSPEFQAAVIEAFESDAPPKVPPARPQRNAYQEAKGLAAPSGRHQLDPIDDDIPF
jgi:hypothetical protein